MSGEATGGFGQTGGSAGSTGGVQPGFDITNPNTWGGGVQPTGMGAEQQMFPGLRDMMGQGNRFLGGLSESLGMGKNPLTMGDVGKAGANFLISSMMANKYSDAANANRTAGSALDQPQRQPYQQQLNQLMTNPDSYFQTNPFAKAAIAQMQNSFGPAMAKSGNPYFEADRLGTNFMTQLGSNFNDQANILSNAGGFNGPVGGQGSSQLMGQGLQQQNEAFRTFGSNIFKQQGPMQGQTGQSLINPNTKLV